MNAAEPPKNGKKPKKSIRAICPALIEETGARLRLIRLAVGLSSKDFADSLNVALNTYSQWENGTNLIPQTKALRIRQIYGATLDYIYTGDVSAMPFKLASAITELDES